MTYAHLAMLVLNGQLGPAWTNSESNAVCNYILKRYTPSRKTACTVRVHERITSNKPTPGVIAAIIGPSVFLVDGTLAVTFDNERLLAAMVATVVAWYTEEMIATITAGLLTLWALVFLV